MPSTFKVHMKGIHVAEAKPIADDEKFQEEPT